MAVNALRYVWVSITAVACAGGGLWAAERTSDDARQIEKALNDGCVAVEQRDVEAMIAPFLKTDKLVMFDFSVPRSKDYQKLKSDNDEFVKLMDGRPTCKYLEIHPVLLSKDAAYSWAILKAGGKLKGGTVMDLTIRSTDVWRKINGKWQIVHEHNSFPADLATGRADLESKP